MVRNRWAVAVLVLLAATLSAVLWFVMPAAAGTYAWQDGVFSFTTAVYDSDPTCVPDSTTASVNLAFAVLEARLPSGSFAPMDTISVPPVGGARVVFQWRPPTPGTWTMRVYSVDDLGRVSCPSQVVTHTWLRSWGPGRPSAIGVGP